MLSSDKDRPINTAVGLWSILQWTGLIWCLLCLISSLPQCCLFYLYLTILSPLIRRMVIDMSSQHSTLLLNRFEKRMRFVVMHVIVKKSAIGNMLMKDILPPLSVCVYYSIVIGKHAMSAAQWTNKHIPTEKNCGYNQPQTSPVLKCHCLLYKQRVTCMSNHLCCMCLQLNQKTL